MRKARHCRVDLILLTVLTGGLSAIALGLSAQTAPATRAAAGEPPGQIAVSPPRFELSLDGGPVSEAIRVLNLSDRALTVSARVANWELDEHNQIREVAPTAQSLDQWLVVNPLRFEIPPRGSQVVRFSVRPRSRPEPGEHRGMIFLEEARAPEAGASTINIRFRFAVAIYATAGAVSRTAVLHDAQVAADDGRLSFRLDVESTGNAHARPAGEWKVRPAQLASTPGEPGIEPATGGAKVGPRAGVVAAGPLPATPVLPARRRWLVVATDERLPAGDYLLELSGKIGETALDRVVPFSVAPSAAPSPQRQEP